VNRREEFVLPDDEWEDFALVNDGTTVVDVYRDLAML
jgi:hypothetical protein